MTRSSPTRTSLPPHYKHDKERYYLPERERDDSFNRTKRIRTNSVSCSHTRSHSRSHSRSRSRSHSPKKRKSKTKSKHKNNSNYSIDIKNSIDKTSKSSSLHHKSKSKKKHKKHKRKEKDDEELQLVQEIREWQQKLRVKKDPVQSSNSTIQYYNQEKEIEKKPIRPSMMPQTQKEYEAEQSVIREVVDPVDGRVRLIKGSGEVIERIVSKEEHKRINRQATIGDALTYQKRWMGNAR